MVTAISFYREGVCWSGNQNFFEAFLTKISDTQSALNTLTLSLIFHYNYEVSVSLLISLTVYYLGEESAPL